MSVVTPKAINSLRLPIYALMMVLIGYLCIFTLNWGQKTYQEFHDVFISAFLMIFSATTGILVALFADSKKLSFGVAIGVSVVIYAIQEIMMTYVYALHNP